MNFDLHTHPSTKPFLTAMRVVDKKDCWKRLELSLFLNLDENEILGGDRLDSQSCLEQMKKGNVSLGVFPLHPLEIPFAESSIFKLLKTFLLKWGKDVRISWPLMKKIKAGAQGFRSFELMQQELALLWLSTRNSDFRLLHKMPANLSEIRSGVNAFLSIEGGHSLMMEDIDGFAHGNPDREALIVNRLDQFIAKCRDEFGARIAYFTLTHIGRGPLCTQAFAFAQNKEKKIGSEFMPKSVTFGEHSDAIRPIGWKIINKCQENGILIDLKHASYRTRCEYYKHVSEEAEKGNPIPVVASHMGAAGRPFSDFLQMELSKNNGCHKDGTPRFEVERVKGLGGYRFYPISLNLFDEEIRFIVRSKGLIGISLDQRILGEKRIHWTTGKKAWRRKNDLDYFCKEDLDWLKNSHHAFSNQVYGQQPNLPPFSSGKVEWNGDVIYLAHNILRFVYAGGPETWKQLCIGTDYDGLIDPIEACQTAADMGTFRKRGPGDSKKQNLHHALKTLINSVDENNRNAMFQVNMDDLDEDLTNKIDDIFEHNGVRFLQTHFSH